MSARSPAQLARQHELELAVRDLRIADLEAKVLDLAKDKPEYEVFRRDIAALTAELDAMRAAGADTDRAFLEEVGALHSANEVLRLSFELQAAELAAARAALTEASIGDFTERASLQAWLRAQAEDEVRQEMDELDGYGQELEGRVRRLENELRENNRIPWIVGLTPFRGLLSADRPIPVFRLRVNGHNEIIFTDEARKALDLTA